MAGRVNVACEIVLRLAARNHDATVVAPADLDTQVAMQGMSYVRIAPDGDPPQRLPSGLRAALRLRRLGDIQRRRATAVDALDPAGMARDLDALEPDLLLIDAELPAHIITAAAGRTPVAVWTTMLSVWKRPGLPPLHTDISPGTGLRGTRAGIEWAWLRFRTARRLAAMRQRVTRLGTDRMTVLRALAARTGFDFDRGTAANEWLIPVVFPSLPMITFNAWELEFPHEPAPGLTYAGPVLNPHRRVAGPAQEATVARLEELFARRRTGASSALVYCAFGAWHKGDDRAFLRRVIDAADRDWDLVVGLGSRIDRNLLGTVPDNVHLFDWAPQMEVLDHADVALHHAGISSVNECIRAGVPMVLYPFDFLDQRGNAARVAYHGLGEVGDRQQDSAGEIRRRITSVLSDDRCRTRVMHMRRTFLGYEEDERATRAVEALL